MVAETRTFLWVVVYPLSPAVWVYLDRWILASVVVLEPWVSLVVPVPM